MLQVLPILLLPPVLGAESSDLISLQLAGALDLVGLAVSIWALWTAILLPLGGKLQRAFRLIGVGAVAFAASHLLDLLLAGLQALPGKAGFVVTQGTVLASMLVFVPGLADLADVLPTLPSARGRAQFPRLWPVGIGLTAGLGALCFIVYGLSPEGELITLLGLDVGLLATAVLCVLLLLRARIGGVIGRSLWLALGGVLVFSLAHPLQIWLVEESTLPATTLAVLHRLIVMPALILFVLSISRVARTLSYDLTVDPDLASGRSKLADLEEPADWSLRTMSERSPRARAVRLKRRMLGKPGQASARSESPGQRELADQR